MINLFKNTIKLTTTTTAKDLYWMFGGNLTAIALAFLATIIIARFITQSEYGMYLALFSWSTLVAELSDFGINTSLSIFFPKLIKEKKIAQVQRIYQVAFSLELISGSAVMLISFLLLPLINRTIFISTPKILLIVTVVETFFVQLTTFAIMTQAAYQKFKEFAFVSVFFGVCRLVLLLGLWYWQQVTVLNILLIQLISSVLNVLFAQKYQKFPLNFSHVNLKNIKSIFRYSGFMGITKLLSALANRLDLLMLLPLAGATITGVYGAASRISQIYPFLLTGFGQVLAPKMAAYEGRDALPFLRKSLLVVMLFLGTMLIFYLFAPWIILFLFDSTYLESIPVFKGLLLAMTGYVLSVPFMTLLVYTYKKPQIMTLLVLVQLIIIGTGNLYFIPKYGSLGPTYSLAMANTTLFVLSVITTIKFISYENRY